MLGPYDSSPGSPVPALTRYEYNVFDEVIATELAVTSTDITTGLAITTATITGYSYDQGGKLVSTATQNPASFLYVADSSTLSFTPASASVSDLTARAQSLAGLQNSPLTNQGAIQPGSEISHLGTLETIIYGPDSVTTSVTYGWQLMSGQIDSQLLPSGLSFLSEIDRLGRVISTSIKPYDDNFTDGFFETSSYKYDNLGGVVQEVVNNAVPVINTLPRIETLRRDYSYDAIGRVKELRLDAASDDVVSGATILNHGLVLTSSWEYSDGLDDLTVEFTNANSEGFTSITDPLGRVLEITGDVPSQYYSYWVDGSLKSFTDELGRTTDYSYDSRGRLTQVAAPAPSLGGSRPTSTFTYTADSMPETITDPLLRKSRYTYDGTGGVSSYTPVEGQFAGNMTYVRNSIGQVVSQIDGLGHVSSYQYDSQFNLIKSKDPQGHETKYSYDALGNRLSVIDALGNQTLYEYDYLNRLVLETAKTRNDSSFLVDLTRSYTYDTLGNLRSFKDRNHRFTEFGYDQFYRTTSESWKEGATVLRSFDFAHDNVGRLVSVEDSDPYGTDMLFAYNTRGELEVEGQDMGLLDGQSVVFNRGYDAVGNRISLATIVAGASDFANRYTYDNLDRLTNVEQGGPLSSGSTTGYYKNVEFGYNLASQLTSISRSDARALQDGPQSAYSYDPAGRLSSIIHATPGTLDGFDSTWSGTSSLPSSLDAADIFAAYSFNYDSANRITSFASYADNFKTQFSYNDRNELTGSTNERLDALLIASFLPENKTFDFDETGNRLGESGQQQSLPGDHNRLKTDGTFDYTYDNEGNQQTRIRINDAKEKTVYEYDFHNNLTKVSYIAFDPIASAGHEYDAAAYKTVEYFYDVFNRRIGSRVRNAAVVRQSDIAESATADIDQTPTIISFSHNYVDPIVVAEVTTSNDAAAVTVRISNVTTGSFQVQLQELDYSVDSGVHATETIRYYVVERGTHVLNNGTILYADTTSVDNGSHQANIAKLFGNQPQALASIQSNNDMTPALVIVEDITNENAIFRLDNSSVQGYGSLSAWRMSETVGFIAFGSSLANPNAVVSNPFDQATGEIPNQITGVQFSSIGETGSVTFSQPSVDSWMTIEFHGKYTAPVIIATASNRDGEPVAVRVLSNSTRTFQVRLDEMQYADGKHGVETIHYMVVESGTYVLPDGSLLLAQMTDVGNSFSPIAFPDAFFKDGYLATIGTEETNYDGYDEAPLVFSQTQRASGNSEVFVSQQKSVLPTGFELRIRGTDGSLPSQSATVGYIAIQRRTTNPSPTPWGNYASSTTTANASYNLAPGSSPVVIAGLQTTSEDDPVTIRRSGVTTSGAQFALQEAGSGPHASETIGYLAFPGSITLLGQTLETDKLTVYVWEGQNEVLRLIDADGNGDEPMRLMNRYLYGDTVDMLLAEEDFVSPLSGLSYAPALDSAYSFVPGNNYWPLSDHLGSIRDVVDSNGTVRMHVVYDEFGNRVEEAYYRGTERVGSDSDYAIDALFGYTGRDWDAETGLQYNRARWYDSTTGRWLSQDPIGFAAGDANLYRYVGNGPVDSTDPSGLVSGDPLGIPLEFQQDWRNFWGGVYEMFLGGHVETNVGGTIYQDKLGGMSGGLLRYFSLGLANALTEAPQERSFASQLGMENSELCAGVFAPGYHIIHGESADGDPRNRFVSAAELALLGLLGSQGGGGPYKIWVYRVEGSVNQRIILGESGQVVITGNKTLWLNFGNRERAEQFLFKRLNGKNPMMDAQIKAFQVPESYYKSLLKAAVPEKEAKKAGNLLKPIISEDCRVTKRPDQLGVRGPNLENLRKLFER